MKKLIAKILLYIIIFAPLSDIKAYDVIDEQRDRNVIWMHGLDGNKESWEYYETLFSSTRRMNSVRESYNTGNGVDYASNNMVNIVDDILGSQSTHHKNMAIGHSMGGVVARNVDKLTDESLNRFGGIVTVASPNNGAYIANSLYNGDMDEFLDNDFTSLFSGPYAQTLPMTWVVPLPSPIFQTAATFFTAGTTPSSIVNIFSRFFEYTNLVGSDATNTDFKVGSSFINELNDFEASVPMISVWANENTPVHWRLLSSAILEKQVELPDDQMLVDVMNYVEEYYNTSYNVFNHLSNVNVIVGFLNPKSWITGAAAGYIAQEWKKGCNWLQGSESLWCSLIDSYTLEEQTYHLPIYICEKVREYGSGIDGGQFYCDENLESFNCYWVDLHITKDVLVRQPSDGLLSKEAQIIEGLAENYIYEVSNANHKSVKNMSFKGPGQDETKKTFNNIFNRNGWFNIKKDNF